MGPIGFVWMFVCSSAWAGSDSHLSGDVAVVYGRNLGQGLNVAAMVGELKYDVHPQVSVGARLGAEIGTNLGFGTARVYLGAPVLAKVEAFASAQPKRPYVGLAGGFTFTDAGGASMQTQGAAVSQSGWAVVGRLPTLAPELGVDLNGLRLALTYRMLASAGHSGAGSQTMSDAGTSQQVTTRVPSLNGLMVQVGGHLGGPSEPH